MRALLRASLVVAAGFVCSTRVDSACSYIPPVVSINAILSDTFEIWTSTLSGATPQLVVSDNLREINHVHACGSNFLFTRYNNVTDGIYATETSDYTNTEAVICNTADGVCQTIQPARPGIIFAGATWSASDCSKILFISNQGLYSPKTSIGEYIPATGQMTYDYLSIAGDSISDPSVGTSTGNLYVAVSVSSGAPGIYSWNGTTLTQLTNPSTGGYLGDTDPTPSPDESYVIFARALSSATTEVWKVTTDPTHTTTQVSPTPGGGVTQFFDGTTNSSSISSDGQLFLIWNLMVTSGTSSNGLYTMTPTGGSRTLLPITGYPTGQLFLTEPSFFPFSGSNGTSQIAYSARIQSRL